MQRTFCFWGFSLFLNGFALFGQDIHWSQFNDNPIFQNPANTGDFIGDTRFIGNFRDQWRSVTLPYQTFSFSIDRKTKSFNYGILAFHDQAGDGKFRTLELQANLSKSFKITSDSMHSITAGLNLGLNHRQLNTDAFYFDSQYNGYIFNPLLPTNENFQTDRKTNLNVGLGALYTYHVSPRNHLKVGLSAFNLNQPNQGFYQSVVKRDVRWVAQVKYCQPIADRWDVLPSIQYSKQGVYDELMVGSSVRYYLPGSDRNYVYKALLAGVWIRGKDADILSVGCEYQDWFVGLSYDINISKLVPASQARGGFEIAVRYILFRFNPKRIDHRVCPDFI
ncbi:MAG: type IX secretion system membrane protein PorP/SprF [Flavobacteriia bacterium]|jgi:type IX secretion system PorP/SprF family membrane protein|nr:type IX secretion system membrane protein PorP/SprF [Flavobacteriia bacterium]NBV92089.1 type IX secretion system membrane protein PorP/SprF [Flavobacteriia bacterium]NBY40089.1 type IX secretion system membrane protein PorP/SprF [Flavobacteriia bacterium]